MGVQLALTQRQAANLAAPVNNRRFQEPALFQVPD
jgi:hypothetical protein